VTDGGAAPREAGTARLAGPSPRLSPDFHAFPRKFQAFSSFFQGNSKDFQTFSLAVLRKIKGLSLNPGESPSLQFLRGRRRRTEAPAIGAGRADDSH
jgi:hypothetical protein